MCDATQNCSGQGVCGPEGACECDCGFYMQDCSSKLLKIVLLWEKLCWSKILMSLRLKVEKQIVHKNDL